MLLNFEFLKYSKTRLFSFLLQVILGSATIIIIIYLFIYRAQRIEIVVNNYRYVYLHPHIFDLGCPGRLAGAACFQTGPCHQFSLVWRIQRLACRGLQSSFLTWVHHNSEPGTGYFSHLVPLESVGPVEYWPATWRKCLLPGAVPYPTCPSSSWPPHSISRCHLSP